MEINRFRDLWLYEFHQEWFPVSPRICLFNLTGENHFEFHVILFYGRDHSKKFKPEDMQIQIQGKNCVVTGANSGIGYAAAECLASR